MRRRILLLAAASVYGGSSWAFSIHDDILSFPQYEIIFSDTYISQDEAESRLSQETPDPRSRTHVADTESPEAPSDLSTRDENGDRLRPGSEAGDTVLETYEHMLLGNKSYLCSIPSPHASKNETEDEPAPQDDEKELARATDRGWQLLQDMYDQCLYYQSGWWSYSFCYQTEVRQFHPLTPPRGSAPTYPPVEDTRVPAFTLGEFQKDDKQSKQVDGKPDSDSPDPRSSELALQTKGDVRYLSQNLTGGSICDLTGKPRRVEVQFHCHPQSTDRIGWIKETATCAYLMVIYTPRLCNDVAFLPPKEHEAEQIVCREVVPESEVESWKSRKAAEAEKGLLAGSTSAPSRPVIGGIEVGGYKLVPDEGARIPPPQVLEQIPNQGQVIAQWTPDERGGKVKRMSDDDIRRLELDPRVVDQMREQMHQKADGRPWKLELVEVGGGIVELIGIVERPDDEWDEDYPPEEEGSEETLKDEL